MSQPDPFPLHQADATREQGVERPVEDGRVGHGRGAPDQSRIVDDPNQHFRVEHTIHAEGPLPPEQASGAGQDLADGVENPRTWAADPVPPPQDVRVMPEEPSVWEATGEDE